MKDLAEEVDFLFQQVAGGFHRDEPGDPDDRGMGPVARAERVVDEHVDAPGELPGKLGIVLRFPGLEADVFQQQDAAVPETGLEAVDVGSDDVGGHLHLPVEELGQADGGRAEAGRRVEFFRAPEVGGEDQLRPVLAEETNRRQRRPDAGVVPDLSALAQGDVEIHPDENGFAADVEIFDKLHPSLTLRCI